MDVPRTSATGCASARSRKADETRAGRRGARARPPRGYGDAPHRELSGGQQQRVALARALINRPTVLLLDEPLGALDRKLRHEMQIELKPLQREVGITFVYVTHDQEEALTMSDVIVVMRDGRIQQQGDPTELYERPVNRFVAGFIGTSNFLPGTVQSIDSASGRVDVRDRPRARPSRDVDRPAATLRVGDAVTVAIRPERLEVMADGAGAPRPGLVGHPRTGPPGHLPRGPDGVRVQTELAGELVVRRQNQRGRRQARAFGPGDPVTVSGKRRRTWSSGYDQGSAAGP